MNVKRFTVEFDLGEMAFGKAIEMLSVMPDLVTLCCGPVNTIKAYEIHKKYDCFVFLIPEDMMVNRFCWSVVHMTDAVVVVPAP